MSITRAEFETGLRRLTGAAPATTVEGHYLLAGIGPGDQAVRCAFEPLPDAVLGGLMRMPRVKVTLDLAALPDAARPAFIAAFDRTFQRGGG